MKSTIVLFGGFLLSSLLHAQPGATHFGLKAGLNVSSVAVSGDNNFNSKLGFYAGGLAHIHINKSWAVQPEIMYSAQGGKDGDQKLNLGYINIPVQLQYMFDNGFRLQTGPQLGFLTAANVKSGNIKYDVKDGLTNADFSWSFGASYLSKSGLGADLRYNLGLTDIDKSNPVEYKNQVLQLGLFYQFMHQHKK